MPAIDPPTSRIPMSPSSDPPGATGSEARAIEKLAAEAIFLALEDDAKRAMPLALSARKRAIALGDPLLELRTLIVCSRCSFVQSKNLIAMASAIDAHELAVKLGAKREIAHALCSIMGVAFAMQLSPLMMPLVERAVGIAKELGDRDLEARSRRIYAEHLANLGRMEESARQFELALDAANALNMPGFAFRIEMRYASFQIGQVEAAAAGRIVKMDMPAVVSLDRMGTHSIRPAVVQSLQLSIAYLRSRVLALRGDILQADAIARQALSHGAKHDYLTMVPPLAIHSARLHSLLGKPDAARESLEHGLDAALSLRPHHWVAKLCRQLEHLESASGMTEASSMWRERACKEEEEFAREQARFRALLEPRVLRQSPEPGANPHSGR